MFCWTFPGMNTAFRSSTLASSIHLQSTLLCAETCGMARMAGKDFKEFLDPKEKSFEKTDVSRIALHFFFSSPSFHFLLNRFLPTCRPPVRLPVVLEIAQPNSKAEMSPEIGYRWKINTRCRPPKFGSKTPW